MPASIRMPAFHMPQVETLGEEALLLRLGDTIDAACNAQVHALARRIGSIRPPWLRDIVPAYASLALFVDAAGFPTGSDPLAEASRWLQQQVFADDGVHHDSAYDGRTDDRRVVDIPVRYGGIDGPDLGALAAHTGLTAHAVIQRHVAAEYMVAMLGFAPGFPYLLGLDPALAMPRLQTPRAHVAAGSVGIGGTQTGIYPRSGPGGWHLIGRTTQVLFDPARDPPSLLAPGDRVRFVAIESLP